MAHKLFVGNLNYETTTDDLRALFERSGTVLDAVVLTDRDTGRSRGFGFVTMATDAEAQAAVDALHEQPFEGRTLTVNEARERGARPAGAGGGRRNSGW